VARSVRRHRWERVEQLQGISHRPLWLRYGRALGSLWRPGWWFVLQALGGATRPRHINFTIRTGSVTEIPLRLCSCHLLL
jgi:hypothetical protein